MSEDYVQRQKKTVVAATVILVSFYSLFFLLQQAAAEDLRRLTLERHQSDQVLFTKAIAHDFEEDIKVVTARLQELSVRSSLQNGDLYGAQTYALLDEKYAQLSGITDRMAAIDENGIATLTRDEGGKNNFVGRNFLYPFVEQASQERRTVASDAFIGLDGRIRLGVAQPIISEETGEYIGAVGASFSPEKLLLQRGSAYYVSSTYIVALDRNGVVLAHPNKELVGKSLDDPAVYDTVEGTIDPIIVFERVMSGTPQSHLLRFQGVQSFASGYPVLVDSKPQYAVFLVTPIEDVYAPLADALFTQNLQAGILIAGVGAGSLILMWTWSGWSKNLTHLVRSRTEELARRNAELEKTKAELELRTAMLHDKTKALEKIDVAKEEFAAMITHELKSPLVPILGYSELLLNGMLGPVSDTHKEKLKIIYESAQSLTRLIQDTLDIHRLEMGRLAFDMRETPAESIVAESVRNFAPAARKKNIAITYHVEPGVNMTCDRNRIIQALGNLISNSIKFSVENDGKIDIAVRQDRDSVTFAVKDNGIGVPKESQEYLFRKFYQADISLARKANGSGLGLAISKGIVNAHNGSIWMESEGVRGKGSTFYFSIPARQQKTAHYKPVPVSPEPGKHQSMASQS